MGRKKLDQKSHTLPPSPTHSFSSSSSSDFEFTISCSPRKSSTALCRPADELFYKGQLLPLHLSPRLSMVRTLLLLPSSSSSSSSSAASDTTASRDSTGSSSNDSRDSCDSSARPSSVAEEDEFKRLNSKYSSNVDAAKGVLPQVLQTHNLSSQSPIKKNSRYFSLSRFSSVFKKDPSKQHRVAVDADHSDDVVSGSNSVKRVSNTAKEVIRKYMKKVKPLYEKLSQKQQKMTTAEKFPSTADHEISAKAGARNTDSGNNDNNNGGFSHSFSGNLRYPRRRGCASSCPSSMRCSPSHSGVLSRTGLPGPGGGSSAGKAVATTSYATVDRSSMDELQSAIQGAIAHCKNSLVQSKSMVSNEI
ncbi:hypothetical protein M0R45_020579 [Rubus argutus]|uniref:Membrane-associated kinase regulator 1 n=1 Tax=Rubus argutus TaxID=59490 RepID=A0AAW1XAZ8_RUBAR